jgi:AraC-like DNA-binding protein
MPEGTATVIYLRSLVQLLNGFGVSEQAFLDELGVPATVLREVDARLPKLVVASAWEVATRRSGLANLGLMAAGFAPPGTFEILDHVTANQPDLEQVARAMVRFYRLCDPDLSMRFELSSTGATISCVFGGSAAEYSRQWAEAVVGLCLARVRTLAQRPDITPLQVWFQHPAPQRLDEHEQFFRCPIVFGASSTGITCGLDMLSFPVRGADAFLSRVLLEYAEGKLRHLPTTGDMTSLARRALLGLGDGHAPDLSSVARQAHCSPRTLQGRLRAEGTSFSRLLDEVRKDLALRYIANRDLRIIELPLLLRYADPSPFYRAFKRWTGMTPEQYRRGAGRQEHVT